MHRVPVFLSTLVFVGMETLYVGLDPNDGIGHGTHMASFIAGVFLAPYYSAKIQESDSKIVFDISLLRIFFEKSKVGGHELEMIKEADEPELVDAWVEKFWELQQCPDCDEMLSSKAECSGCGKNFSY